MYYFIPAWFKNDKRSFYNVAEPWYRDSKKIEFDDSINQIKMFEQAGTAVELLILGYMPNLRSFLQRQELDGTAYISIFDELQGVELRGTRKIMVNDLKFPADAEFVYTPFRIMVYHKEQLYAKVDIGTLGELLTVTRPTKQYVFDDRGFLSSILYTTAEGTPLRQEYLDLAGEVRFVEELQSGKVQIAPAFLKNFKYSEYENIQALVTEKFSQFLQRVTNDDAFVLAAGGQRTKLALELISGPKIIMSYFTGRNKELAPLQAEPIAKAYLAVADTKATADLIAPLYPAEKIKVVTPFDTRLRLGHSQRLAKDWLLFLVDEIATQTLDQALRQILELMRQQPKLGLELGVFRKDSVNLHNLRAQILAKAPDFKVTLPDDEKEAENQLEEKKYAGEVHLFYLDTENEIVRALDRARVLIDLGTPPVLYAQIAAISAGVPQIVLNAEQLVEHEKNGSVLQGDINNLTKAIKYYTQELKYWNEAMMYAVAKISELTSGNLARRWQTWLEQSE